MTCAYCERDIPTPETIKDRPACEDCNDDYLELLLATEEW